MHVKIEGGNVIITVPIDDKPKLSSSGKSYVLATTHGFVKTDQLFKGRPVSVGLNVIVSAQVQQAAVEYLE